ncbi:NUDIX hydrolase [Candidatus Parabeggiatoa sp. HSG14]|uniref:NUDIX hydrolase n=1 Tax=Candidatus Parabeggiatoa sp. HSG14 TaxID=3055593 RepID=UPI0025A69D2E|nr:NUDIX hydrolase [Thiotrichales bacterium HSG14]
MYYCSQCGSKQLIKKVPEGDTRSRIVCEKCHSIHYQNPKIVTGCLPIWEDKVLLCKRAIEPRSGFWTLPAGYMEKDESVKEGAIRETWEEAGANVKQLQLYLIVSSSQKSVSMIFLGQLCDLKFAPGIESLDVQLFTKEEIPWEEISFRFVREALTYYFEDRVKNQFPVRVD